MVAGQPFGNTWDGNQIGWNCTVALTYNFVFFGYEKYFENLEMVYSSSDSGRTFNIHVFFIQKYGRSV